MFVDHYGSLIRQQINSLGLNISIAWLGSELEHVISRVEGQPFLVLNWEPNTVSRLKQMTRISFPPCRCAFHGLVKILYCTVESWFLEPLRETPIGARNQDFQISKLRLQWSKSRENNFCFQEAREIEGLRNPDSNYNITVAFHQDYKINGIGNVGGPWQHAGN